MYYLNGERIFLDKPFKDAEGNQYPADWLSASTQEQRDALGITYTEPTPAPVYNRRFYNADGTAKPLADQKAFEVQKIKDKVNEDLSSTDWYVVRAYETGVAAPADVTAYRADVRTVCNSREAEINACADIPELEALIMNRAFTDAWPQRV